MRGDRLAEGAAQERLVNRILVRGACDTQRTSTNGRTCAPQGLQDSDTALATLTIKQIIWTHSVEIHHRHA